MRLLKILFALLLPTHLLQSEVKINETLKSIRLEIDNETITIQRVQDPSHKLNNAYTKTSRPTPPFGIQPFSPVEGIQTISELDILTFLQNEYKNSNGLLVDARLDKWYNQSTIPGAINIPFSYLIPKKDNAFIKKVFEIFEFTNTDSGTTNFKNALHLIIFDNGPWCKQGVMAVKNLVALGYPKEKIKYYRGGMQYWQILGLTTIKP